MSVLPVAAGRGSAPAAAERGSAPVAALAALALLVLTLAFAGLGSFALLDPDEARYAESSREMIERGDYVVPYFNYEPRLKKPPLFYWGQIAAFRTIGVGETGARLPSALAFVALIVMVTAFARRQGGWSVALRTGAILATMPLVFVAARAAIIDMTLCLFVTAALLLYWFVETGDLAARSGSILIGVSLGLAILAKGPVGVIAPLVAIVAYHLVRREWSALRRWKGPLLAAVVTVAVSLPWLLMVVSRVGLDTFYRTAMRETVERHFETGLEHPEPVYFYLLVLPLAAFPWSAFFIPGYLTGTRRALTGGAREGLGRGDGLTTFLWVWIAGMLLFFSLGAGKLATYILPVMPAVALWLGREWSRWSGPAPDEAARRRTNLEWAVSVGLLVPVVALAFALTVIDPTQGDDFRRYAPPLALCAVIGIGGALALSSRGFRWAVVPVLTVSIAFLYMLLLSTAGPELERSRSLRQMVQELRLDEREDTRICVYRDFAPSLVFYAQRRIERADNQKEFEEFMMTPGDVIVVMDVRRFDSLSPRWRGVLRQVAVQGEQLAFERVPGATPEAIESLIDATRLDRSISKERKQAGSI